MFRTSVIFFAVLMLALPAHAQSTPPAQSQGSGSVIRDIADVVFKEAEKRIIKDYFEDEADAKSKDDDDDGKGKKKDKKNKAAKGKGRGNGLPPGLAKRDQLPPGLAKRGNQLPPGLQKGDLPPELESKLPDLPDNVERVIVDESVLLIEKGTNVILDVIDGVLRGQ